MDLLDIQQRSALMKRVKQANTKPELIVRKELHRRGLRYVIGDRRLPGSPDLAFPRHRAVVFVHGCFWHGHGCRKGRLPSSNVAYWKPKIAANRERDQRKVAALQARGWRVFTVWECEIGPSVDLPGRMDALAANICGRRDETTMNWPPDYDFDYTKAVRGKYYKRLLKEGSNVVVLETEIARAFPNSAAVNEALRVVLSASKAARGLTRRSTRTRAKPARAG